MKKIILYTFAACISMVASNSFAAQLDSTQQGTLGFTPSSDVVLDYINDGNTSPQGYIAQGKHKGGNRVVATTDNSNLVYQEDDAWKGLIFLTDTLPGITLLTAGDAGDNVEALTGAGWTTL